jgi:histone H3/H4
MTCLCQKVTPFVSLCTWLCARPCPSPKATHYAKCTFERAIREPFFSCNEPANLLCFAATVQKIVTEILPPSSGLVFGKDARDLLIECCVEFITLISSEANDISEKESKKTIACDHITKALEQLGFGAYVSEIMEVANEHKEQLKVCKI